MRKVKIKYGTEYIKEIKVEKDVFGNNIVVAIDTDRHKRYEARKRSDGMYEILNIQPWYCTKANVDYGRGFWFDIEPFPNLMQAFRFLKENLDSLL